MQNGMKEDMFTIDGESALEVVQPSDKLCKRIYQFGQTGLSSEQYTQYITRVALCALYGLQGYGMYLFFLHLSRHCLLYTSRCV